MTASYPGALHTFTPKADGVDWVLADHINEAHEEIIATQTELGINVAGSLTNLVTRLAVALDDDGTLKLTAITEHTGIADNNIVEVDGVSNAPTALDYAKWTANGLEGRSYAEVLTDLSGQATAAFAMNSQKITGVLDPTAAQDAATKNYVDAEGKRTVQMVLLDGDTDLATGDDFPAFTWTVPELFNGWEITDVDFAVETASTSGLPSFALYNVTDSVDILSVNCTIDANEKTSYTATTGPTINTANDDVATGDEIRFDCDAAGTGTKGCTVILVLEKP
jgi:hypothetical protein